MAVLISARELTHGFGQRPLFRGISFTLSEGDRVGLIGPNGAGKSTLLRLLAGEFLPDLGEVQRQSGLAVAYLEQVPTLHGRTVRDAVQPDGHAPAEGWHASAAVDEWLNRLELDADAELASLSGGWKKRVALARALVQGPDLLLLDEPTNHLDVDCITWLERFLASARFATLTITHDRLFLQRVATRILELDPRNPAGLLDVRGDYATYLQKKAELMAAQEQQQQVLENTLRRETEWLQRGAKARSTKQQARIQRAEALAGEVKELGVRNRTRDLSLDFQGREAARAKRLIEGKGLGKRYGERIVFEGVDLLVTPKTRLGLLGANGSGKSTLLRVLTGEEAPSSGELFRADDLRVAFFEQHRSALDPSKTPAETVAPDGDHVLFRGVSQHRHGYLERFGFRNEQMVQPVESLSGGEQSRLLIACLMLQPANLLVLDEPTNDLDMQTLDVLERALADFDGAVLLVSHDRYFLDQVSNQLIAFEVQPSGPSRVTAFADLGQWEAWQAEQARAAKGRPSGLDPSAAGTPPEKAPPARAKKKLSFKEQRDWDTLEQRILEAEERVATLEAEGALPEVASDAARVVALHAALTSAQEEVAGLYARWAELEALLQGAG